MSVSTTYRIKSNIILMVKSVSTRNRNQDNDAKVRIEAPQLSQICGSTGPSYCSNSYSYNYITKYCHYYLFFIDYYIEQWRDSDYSWWAAFITGEADILWYMSQQGKEFYHSYSLLCGMWQEVLCHTSGGTCICFYFLASKFIVEVNDKLQLMTLESSWIWDFAKCT